ncbi:Dihydrolipoyllysine-residue acetyltransferase component of pyruvate dehydrogenase complex [Phytophthora citrophthora]|uniref:dihydrolipoyllysine-residue succinyltransferase n=1 Tax=Phytophthora citrophthora TaxID=4793 RepID=A0AAD9H0C9_9STRA|nr:Dihydrolipoyllysine-residue acetyltransferase component of pyruvate dehydrogenase complex [Phytophthora citrophthora]
MQQNTPPSASALPSSMTNGSSSFLRKSGHLYKKTGLGRSWRPRFFSLEGTVLYYYKREGDSVPKGIVVLTGCHIRATKDKKLYSFRISHPKTSKVYDLAATLPSRTEDWIQALSQAATMAQNSSSPGSGRLLTSNTSSSDVLHSSSSQSTLVDASVTELLSVPGAAIPDQYRDRMEGLLADFVAQARDDADVWKFQTEQRGVKAYVRRASRIGAFKGVGFIAHHPQKVLQLVLELSKRHTFDPQLLATQRVHVFNDHMWVDHLTYKAVFPAAARDFVNLTHWRVLKDGSVAVVATYADDESFVKNQEPQVVRGKIEMAGFLLTPNEDYTGVNATYITKVDVKAGIPAGLQAKMFIKQAFVVDGLRKALDDDETAQQWEHVTNSTLFGISTTDCVEDEEEAFSMRSQSADVQDQEESDCNSSYRASVVPEEGFPTVPEEYSEIIEKAVARMEAEMSDEAAWNFIGEKDGVKAYTKVDGSLTAAKGVGYLPYHPRAIWDQVINPANRKLVDPQLALGMNLKALDKQTSIDYLEYKSMFVVAGRDFCNLTHWRVLPGGTIIVVAQSIEVQELCPLKEPKVVRGDLHLGCTKIVPNATYDGAEVTTMVKTDLKGNIPARIAGKAAADQPFVISRMGEVIKARRDLAQVAAQGKLSNTLFELPRYNKRSSSVGSAKTSSVVKNGVVPKSVSISSGKTLPKTPEEKVATPQKTKPKAVAESVDVMDLSKAGKNNGSDVAMYAIQFGGAVLALKTVGLPTVVHLALVIGLILFFALKLHLGPSRMSPRRKMMISTFGPPDSGMILGTLQLDMTKTNQYIAERRKDSDCHLTITHIVLRALGEALSKAPSVNGHLVFGSYYPAPTVDISCLVAMGAGKDLGVCRLVEIDKMTLQDVCNRVRGDATKIRSGKDKGQEDRNKIMSVLPTWAIRPMLNFFGWLGSACGFRIPPVGVEPYMFGSCMVTSVGMMGLDMAFSPITPYAQVPMLVTIGSIMDKAIVLDGKVVVRPMLTLTTTIDHRYVDGSEAARMAKNLKAFVEDPNLLEAVPGA